VLEKAQGKFHGIIIGLGMKKTFAVGKDLLLSEGKTRHFLAGDYIFCFPPKQSYKAHHEKTEGQKAA